MVNSDADLNHVLTQKSSNCVPKVGLVWTSQQFMKPNWKRHTSIVGEGSTKRNKIMKLNFCLHEFRGSATRAVNHLAGRGTGIRGCPQILESVRDMYWNYGKVSGFNSDLDEKPAAVNSVSQSKISQFGFSLNRDRANEQLALFCYTSGVSFICFDNPHFLEFCRILNIVYVPPSRRVIVTSLLDAANSKVENLSYRLSPQSITRVPYMG